MLNEPRQCRLQEVYTRLQGRQSSSGYSLTPGEPGKKGCPHLTTSGPYVWGNSLETHVTARDPQDLPNSGSPKHEGGGHSGTNPYRLA